MPNESAFHHVARLLPEPLLLLTRDGGLVAANAPAHRLLGISPEALAAGNVLDYVSDDPGRIGEFLRACASSRQFVPGAVRWKMPEGTVVRYRCEGGLFHPADPPDPALIMVRLRMPEASPDGFALLTRKIDELNREIHARRRTEAELARFNESLEQEVRHRTDELSAVNLALRGRNEELQGFAYTASHDLKEPLRKISTYAGLVASEYAAALDEEGRGYLARISDSAARMTRLISDLLAYSGLATNTPSLKVVDLGMVVRDVLSDLETRLDDTGGHVLVGELPVVEADPTQMRQLLQNLIGNALKFHRKGVAPLVEVQATREARGDEPGVVLRLSVRDNGIGFEPELTDAVFAPFKRLHGREQYEGTGIGLAICRRIAERHGGQIHARSIPGQGSEFVVEIPARGPAAMQESPEVV